MKDMFPNVVSYNRLTELQKVSLLPLFAFFRIQLGGKCTSISFVDSTPLRVCKIKESASIKFLLVLPSEVAALWDGSMGFIQVLIQNIIC